MGDIALRGNRLTVAKGGRARLWHGGSHNTGRTNLLEQLGRVEGERSNPNRRAEISRVHGELNRGYAKGGRAGYKHSGLVAKVIGAKKGWDKADIRDARIAHELAKRGKKSKTVFSDTGKSHGKGHRLYTEKGKKMFGVDKKAEGGRIGFKKGTDKRWMQKVSASIKKRGTKGKCTPITKPGCTGRAKALAKTFKKIAAKRKKKTA
jgi:hypothetical protein